MLKAYFDATAKALYHHGSPNCTNAVGNAFRHLQQLISGRDGNRMKDLFNLCTPPTLDNEQDIQLLYAMLIDSIPYTINTLQ